MRSRRLDILVVICLGGVLFLSGYLCLRGLAVRRGLAEGADVCRAVFGTGCDATLSDPFSTQGGIPLAGWGVVGTASVLLLLFLGRVLGESFGPQASAGVSVLLGAGGLVSAALVAGLLAGAFPLCPLCLVANGMNLVGVAAWTWPRARSGELRDHLRRVASAARYLVGAKPADAASARLTVLTFALVAVSGFCVYQWIRIEGATVEAGDRTRDQGRLIADFDRAPVTPVDVDPSDPALGPAAARAEVVVFSDAFCPFCRRFWTLGADLVSRYGQDLRIVHKHFPLDRACNLVSAATLHPAACAAAQALEAARMQDSFWAYLDRLGDVPGLRGREDPFGFVAQDLGLDVERFRSDVGRETVRGRVQRDVEIGRRLGVSGTPAVFLNGRRLTDFRSDALPILLDHVIGRETSARE